MKMKLITILMLLFATFTRSYAQEDEVHLGYCSGEVATQGAFTVNGKTWVSGAIYLPTSILQRYTGAKIVRIRAGLASKLNIDSLRVWVRDSLNGPDLSNGTITLHSEPKISRGWNDVSLDSAVEVKSAQGLYIGYSYHQKTATGAISAVGSKLTNAFFAQVSTDGEWKDMSSKGILSVEGVLVGVQKPDYDLALLSAKATPHEDGATYLMKVKLANNGTKPVTGFTLKTSYTNGEEAETTHLNDTIAPGENAEIAYDISRQKASGSESITVSIISLDDGEDATAENNSVKASFGYERKVLVEEYTTEKCSNCPRVAGYIKNALAMPKYSNNVVVVCHHAGYYTDWLTQECDKELCEFYGVSYAPAVMFDRSNLDDLGLYLCPDQSMVCSILDYRLAQETKASVSINATYDENSRKLNLTVSGEREGVFTKNPRRLIIYLTESNIEAHAQAGVAEGETYLQQHVIRAYNGTWGDVIDWNINQFSRDYSFDIDTAWNPSNMQIVACIASYNSSDKTDCVIENVGAIPFPLSTGINKTSQKKDLTHRDYYTLGGAKLNGNPTMAGIYIVTDRYSDGSVITQKMLWK